MTALCRRCPIVFVSLAVLSVLTIAGCAGDDPSQPTRASAQNPSPDQISKMRDPNVVEVAAFYNPFDPWLWTESRERPRGIVIRALYLMGPRYKGIFGDGIIRPRLYVRDVNDRGQVSWKLAKEWTFTVEDAIDWRSKRQTQMGWGYRLHLEWDEITRLEGRQVRMVVEFERIDGRRIASDKKDFRVPSANAS